MTTSELKSSDMTSPEITFGDKVRVRATTSTQDLGIAGQTGIVHGSTTPWISGVEVIGDSTEDYAIAVIIDCQSTALWFASNLLEFLDHQPGTTVEVGGLRLNRDEQGHWHEAKPKLTE
jgi:hypothetical protein